jgi:hypothetical protein
VIVMGAILVFQFDDLVHGVTLEAAGGKTTIIPAHPYTL